MWRESHVYLSALSSPLGALVTVHGLIELERSMNRFAHLVRAIVGQQLSTRAAAIISGRVLAAVGGNLTASTIGSIPEETLHDCGLSTAKLRSVKDLAQKVRDGFLDLEEIDQFADDEIVNRLVEVRGIGVWTAQMFLIFALNRPDVLPLGDLGIQNGVARLYGLENRPSPSDVSLVAKDGLWHPYATVACLHLWRSLSTAG